MPKGVWADAEVRVCPVCSEEFTAVRRAQITCKKCRYTQQALALKAQLRAEAGQVSLESRPCEKCGQVYTPRRPDQRTCGAQCPGTPRRQIICLVCQQVVEATWRGETNQVYCSESCREKAGKLRRGERFRRYRLTRQEFEAKEATQEGRCASCGELPAEHRKHAGLVVDHDHATGEVRDLLCSNCNTGLGLFGDDPAKLRMAAEYLERWLEMRPAD